MIGEAKVQEEIYLKELERLMSRRPDLVKISNRGDDVGRWDDVRQWNVINCMKIYKDKIHKI